MKRMSGSVGSLFLSLPWVAVAAGVAYTTKPDKLPEFKNWMSPPPYDIPKGKNAFAQPAAPVQAPKFELRSVNGKLVVDAASAPGCVAKILEIKASQPQNCMA